MNARVQSPRSDLGGGTEAKINLFLEYGNSANQIKAEGECRNMVVNILPTDTSSTPGWGQKVKPYLFLKVLMLLITGVKTYVIKLIL